MRLTPGLIAPGPLAVAVSGGGDSLALLHMLAHDGPVHVVTVDHGLRDVADEIALVGTAAAALGYPHSVLRWTWDERGNLQAAARQGRREVIAAWAAEHGIQQVALGHTQDDQAETVLMRLARGSGVDGLAGMAAVDRSHGLWWIRPLLGCTRESLREVLRQRGQTWADDPSNDDLRFDRVKARQMAAQLADLGLTPERLVQTADHMAAARRSLNAAAARFARDHVRQQDGDIWFPPMTLDTDTHRRVLAKAIGWIGGATYRPRFAAMCAAWDKALTSQAVLAGVVLRSDAGGVRLTREAAASKPAVITGGKAIWDHRWAVTGPDGAWVRALGEDGIQRINWRDLGLPRISLLGSPSVWLGDDLIAAPVAGMRPETARIVYDFHDILDSD